MTMTSMANCIARMCFLALKCSTSGYRNKSILLCQLCTCVNIMLNISGLQRWAKLSSCQILMCHWMYSLLTMYPITCTVMPKHTFNRYIPTHWGNAKTGTLFIKSSALSTSKGKFTNVDHLRLLIFNIWIFSASLYCTYRWLQKHRDSGPTCLQSMPVELVHEVNSLFFILCNNNTQCEHCLSILPEFIFIDVPPTLQVWRTQVHKPDWGTHLLSAIIIVSNTCTVKVWLDQGRYKDGLSPYLNVGKYLSNFYLLHSWNTTFIYLELIVLLMKLMLNNLYIEIGSKHFTGTNQLSRKALHLHKKLLRRSSVQTMVKWPACYLHVFVLIHFACLVFFSHTSDFLKFPFHLSDIQQVFRTKQWNVL